LFENSHSAIEGSDLIQKALSSARNNIRFNKQAKLSLDGSLIKGNLNSVYYTSLGGLIRTTISHS
jgi:hypothetical protein